MVDVCVDRNQHQPEKTEQIRDRKQFSFPIFDIHGIPPQTAINSGFIIAR